MRLTALAALLALPALAIAGTPTFTAGNFVALRAGDGSVALSNTGSAVFLDEISPTGTLVRSLPLPVTANGAQRQCILSGTATAEGMLTRSGDGSKLLLGCYGRDLGGTGNLATSTAAAVNRVIAVINADSTIDTSTALADAHTGASFRSVASADGSGLYAAGGNEGVRLTQLGGTTSTVVSSTTASGNLTNLRNLGIWGGNLFVTNGSGTNPRLQQVGSGLPTAAGTQMAGVPGMPTDRSFYGFHFADRSTDVPGLDTLYVADDSATTPGAGVLKYSLVGGTWVANGRVAMVGARGLAAQPGTGGYLIAVAAEADCATGAAAAGSSRICGILDTGGYNEAFTPAGPGVTLATAGTNTAFRGVANAPVASSSPGVLGVAPSALAFGNQSVGSTSAAQTVTLSNTGGAALTVGSLTAAAAPFARSGGSCTAVPITLAAGASCTLTYTHTPTATGPAAQTLTIDAAAAGTSTVELSGTGIQGALLLPANVSFPTQPIGVTSAPLTATLSNTGTDSLQVTALTAADAPFALSGGSCATALPFDLAAGASCTLIYTFTPSAPGAAAQSINVTANAPGSGSFALSGTGGASADLSIVKTSDLALVAQGLIQYALVVSNAGPSAVTGATVTDTFAAGLNNISWTCVGINGAGCAGSGVGNIAQSVDLPVGGAVYYSIVAAVPAPLPAQFSNTASVAVPAGVTDPVPGNDSSTVVDVIGIYADGFEAVPTQVFGASNGALQRIELPAALFVDAARDATPVPAARYDLAGNLAVIVVRRIGGTLQAQLLTRDPLGRWQAGGWREVSAAGLRLEWQTGAASGGVALLSAQLAD